MGSDFAYRLYYDSTPDVAQSLKKHNGNIVAMDWRTKTPRHSRTPPLRLLLRWAQSLTEAQKCAGYQVVRDQ